MNIAVIILQYCIAMKQQCQICKNGFQELCSILKHPNVSLVPMNMINSFSAVPFQDDNNGCTRNDFNDLERDAVTEEKCESAILEKRETQMMVMVILKIIPMNQMTMIYHMITIPI